MVPVVLPCRPRPVCLLPRVLQGRQGDLALPQNPILQLDPEDLPRQEDLWCPGSLARLVVLSLREVLRCRPCRSNREDPVSQRIR